MNEIIYNDQLNNQTVENGWKRIYYSLLNEVQEVDVDV